MAKKMRAMVLSELAQIETKPLKLTQIDRHEIKRPNEILIKIEACGVCHSQLHGIEGDWKELGIPPQLPTVPGHELVGKIIEYAISSQASITYANGCLSPGLRPVCFHTSPIISSSLLNIPYFLKPPLSSAPYTLGYFIKFGFNSFNT